MSLVDTYDCLAVGEDVSTTSVRDAQHSQALPGLIADTENFERRFDFWEGRLAQLS